MAIPAVPTSITAFVGRTRRGPTDRPVAVTSFAEFESVYGGLWEHGSLPSSVRDFFGNGGGSAVVARLYRADDGEQALAAKGTLALGTLLLEAADEGAWGNELRARIDHDVPAPNAPDEQLFTLSVRDGTTGTVEVFAGLSAAPTHPRFVTAVLADQSRLVRVTSPGTARPDTTPDAPAGVVDVTVAGDAEASDGQPLDDDAFVASGHQAAERGLYLLEQADVVNLLVIPPYTADGGVGVDVVAAAAEYCEERRAVLLLDPSPAWRSVADVLAAAAEGFEQTLGTSSANAALFYPRLHRGDPAPGEGGGGSGAVAGVVARTDASRGVWAAPAGEEARLDGVQGLALPLPDGDIARLASVGVNALRTLPGAGPVVWGARTLQGADGLSSDWTYLPVRRLALFIEESLDLGTRWAVFEPNDAALWARIRLDAVALLDDLFRRGAFQGATPQQAYVVRCDSATTTQADVDLGVVNVVVGFAPLKPAEFVMIRLQQLAGQPRNGGS